MLFIKTCHKWLSLLVGLQLFIWIATGLYFNLMDHKKASGRQYQQHGQQNVVFDKNNLLEPQKILQQQVSSQSLKLISLLAQPYYLLTRQQSLYRHLPNHYLLINAYSGEPVVIDQSMAITLASATYSGPGKVSSALKLSPPIADIPKEKNQVWQVNFADDINTSVYLDAGSGQFIRHSNDDKRFADIFFMLHFMDYASKGNFNNWQIIVFAIFTAFLSLTGLIWTIELAFNGQYKLVLKARKKTIKVFDKKQQLINDFSFKQQQNLLDGLLDHDIALPSSCGGGGTCGRCKIIVDEHACSTAADLQQLSSAQLKQGIRLACQHKGAEVTRLTLIERADAHKLTLRLTSNEFISPFIKELRFRVCDGSKLAYRAGAYMRFFIPEANGYSIPQNMPEHLKPHWHHIEHLAYQHLACSRSYSLANHDSENDELVFTIKFQSAPNHKLLPGVGSSYLCNLAVGETIDAIGPFEDLYAQADSDKTMVMIGAGAGMAPLKALTFEQLEKFKNQRDIYFYFGARSEQDLIYYPQFLALNDKYDHFQYIPTLSRADDSWTGARGYAQELLEAQLETELEKMGKLDDIEFYVCGPAKMMADTITMLNNQGVDKSAIYCDDFSR